ncbi:MAG: AAA family ATPase, partial [Bacteroidota bacterium]
MNYGATVKAEQLIQLLQHQFQRNRQLMQKGRPGTPVCIWGAHGIGKTQIVRDFAKQNNWKCISLAPAQFEEMGDLLGMPQIEGKRTVFRKPAWVPEDFGPGILLLDDFNRADDRIIRGLMPLLQDGQTVSWGLPPDWHIVLTANPDNGDYSVTPLDASLLTRMLHVELIFDLNSWANWATNYRIPSLLIDFVLLYPDLIDHERTTARSLVQFFDSLQGLNQTKSQKALISVLAQGFIGEAAAR